ncbi:NUDIX domain-containing protein [Acinetobacter larvae]|uniref:8-oxo-dGTP diphosphatase n=1 Tax=Acinetobacter larvae TaxID=1789224 RepID=A0A1B2LY46_9GAMM|nr:NUDIX domain-containing protein [Acinetobacter larvae]AOA57860.1 hypothetical protein BFG52_05495 [Acinetobacter larvae]
MKQDVLKIAIGLVYYQGQVLVGWRNAAQHQGNRYEFPGGKVEAGESAEQACRREILEETGLDIRQWHPITSIQHRYDDLSLELDFFSAYCPREQLTQRRGAWQWYNREQLLHLKFPKANQRIVQQLCWPHYIKISAEHDALTTLASDHLLYWRPDDQEPLDYTPLTTYSPLQLQALMLNIRHWQALTPQLQQQIHTIHFKQHQFQTLSALPRLAQQRYLAACHDAAAVQQAHALGFDAILLSPVLKTASHPEQDALGWQQFQAIAAQSDLPVFALGGMHKRDLDQVQRHHGFGVAGIRAF